MYELIWHASDSSVKPIVANRRIERLPEPKWDAQALPFTPLVSPPSLLSRLLILPFTGYMLARSFAPIITLQLSARCQCLNTMCSTVAHASCLTPTYAPMTLCTEPSCAQHLPTQNRSLFGHGRRTACSNFDYCFVVTKTHCMQQSELLVFLPQRRTAYSNRNYCYVVTKTYCMQQS